MRILIVDDNKDYRKLLRRILEQQEDLLLVAEASGGEEGVRLARQFQPDVVLMDIEMPGTNGFEATKLIKEVIPTAAVLILSGRDTEVDRDRATKCGADAYLIKTISIFEILSAIRTLRPAKVA